MDEQNIQPEYIHQIFINEDNTFPEFPLVIQENIRSVRVLYPRATYKLWNKSELEYFIDKNFEPEVLSAFQTLKPFTYKADLARYCLVYILGGLYMDIGLRLLQPLNPPNNYGIIAFQDKQNSTHIWTSVITGLLWAQPRREELLIAINMIVENCRNQYYGVDPLCPTGPALSGWAITKAMAKKSYVEMEDFWIGYMQFVVNDRYVLITPAGEIVAYKPQNIALGEMQNLLKTNNYGEIWRAKQVYNESKRIWQSYDNSICIGEIGERTENGIQWKNQGMISFGPYISLEQGHYSFEVKFSEESESIIELEIISMSLLLYRNIIQAPQQNHTIIQFECDENMSNVEFRFYSRSNTQGNLLAYSLEKLN